MNRISNAAIQAAVARGLDYILARQSPEGNWTEWQLPPGQSTPWSTAYIGYKLRLAPSSVSSSLAAARKRAAAWLVGAEFPGGGWGYNESVGADADSTAYGVMFLSSMALDVSHTAVERLCQFRQLDGGFSTYLGQHEQDAWGISHPDVTPMVILALLRRPELRSVVESGIQYVLRQQTAEGLWNSFWWETPLYATSVTLAVLQSANVRIDLSQTPQSLLSFHPENTFEAALLLTSRFHAGLTADSDANCQLIQKLIRAQQSDGSWESVPILRVTRRDCSEPWKHHDAGPSFADPARLFTSSTVLEALSQAAAIP